MPEERLLTVREVAFRCHRSEETVRRWIWSGKLSARKLGNQLFVEEGELGRIQPDLRISELKAEYQASPGGRVRVHRGSMLSSKEEELKHAEEDEAFQDEMLAKYGPVDVVKLLRKVREE